MGTKKQIQISMDDQIITNPELEQALEEREGLKGGAKSYNKKNKEAKALIEAISEPANFRVGRFVISRKITSPREVAFETSGGQRISIKLISED